SAALRCSNRRRRRFSLFTIPDASAERDSQSRSNPASLLSRILNPPGKEGNPCTASDRIGRLFRAYSAGQRSRAHATNTTSMRSSDVMRFPDALATLGGLARDAAGGANLALAMLPKAMPYAAVAGVPPAYGLYASCAAPALAVAFGSNRLLFTGPVGVMTVLVLGALHHFAQPFSAAYVELAASLTLMVGVLALLFAAARLGFLVRTIPASVTEGFIAAA